MAKSKKENDLLARWKYTFKEGLRFFLGFAVDVFTNLIGKTVRFEARLGKFRKIERAGKFDSCFLAQSHFLANYYFRFREYRYEFAEFRQRDVARFIQRFGFGMQRFFDARPESADDWNDCLLKKGFPNGFSLTVRKVLLPGKTGTLLAKKTGNGADVLGRRGKLLTIKSLGQTANPNPFTRAKILIAEPMYFRKRRRAGKWK